MDSKGLIDLGIEWCAPLAIGWRLYLRGETVQGGRGRWYVRGKWRPWDSRGTREWTVLTVSDAGTLTEHSVMADSWLEAGADCPGGDRVVGVWLGRAALRDDDLVTALRPSELRDRLEHPTLRTFRDWPEGWLQNGG